MYLVHSDSGAIRDFMSEEDMERECTTDNEGRLKATRFLNDAKREAGTAEEQLQKRTELCREASNRLAALCKVVG